MKAPVSWLQTFVPVPASPAEVATRFGACGFAVESIEGDVIDLEITANRPDCLSIYGLAREAAAAFNLDLAAPPGTAAAVSGSTAPIKVSLGDAGCGRYALAVADVKVGPSPAWLADRLAAAGVRPINNIVDVTNYVMLELGQPMHAFDAARLAGPEIYVRRARLRETLTTLDGVARTLDETMLVIADRERAVAIAGVMGGAASEVSASTTRIALESAWFLPSTVRATSRRLGLKTEASARFERGADINAPVAALLRALQLFADIGAGTGSGGVTDLYPRPVASRSVPLRRARLARLLGDEVPDTEVERLLGRLGFVVTSTDLGWTAVVPSFRVDVAREADLIEEVGRHWGLDRIPATFPALRAMPRPSDAGVARSRLIRRLLCGAGLQEAVTFTFMSGDAAGPFAAADDRLDIKNPLSEKFAVLRPSIVPGLVESLVYNRNRQAADVRLFEVGGVFSQARGERTAVGWVLTGSRGEHWSGSAGPLTFADTRGIADLIASTAGVAIDVAPGEDLPWLARGQRARLVDPTGVEVGWIGRLSIPALDGDAVFAGEVDLGALGGFSTAPRRIAALARHPSIVRDLSILVSERLPAADVRGTIRANAPPTLVDVREFDRYQGKGVPDGQVSVSVRLTFRAPDRTLTDAEAQQAVEAIVAALRTRHDAVLRGATGRISAE
jgi:phenylalanyl-tRNA synthetase beta chain